MLLKKEELIENTVLHCPPKSLLKIDDDSNHDDGDNDNYDNYEDDDVPPVLLLHPDGHLHSESKVVRPISVSVIIVVQIILSYYNQLCNHHIVLRAR